MTDLRALVLFSQCRHTNAQTNTHTDADTVSKRLCFVVQKSHSLSSTHTRQTAVFATRLFFARVLSSRQIVFEMELFS